MRLRLRWEKRKRIVLVVGYESREGIPEIGGFEVAQFTGDSGVMSTKFGEGQSIILISSDELLHHCEIVELLDI